MGVKGLGGVFSIFRNTSSLLGALDMPIHFPALDRCPKEFAIIGKLLAAYGDLEFDLSSAVSVVHSTDMAIKALFRPRGESARVEIADAMAREAYVKAGFETPWCEAIGNFKYCLRVRNQYAHCNWFWRSDLGLGFVDLQAMAEEKKHLSTQNLTVYPLDLALLEAQEGYFAYVQDCLRYLTNAYAKKRGRAVNFDYSKPAKSQQPIQRNPGIQPSRQNPNEPESTPQE